jgi:hypothetical protein
MRFLPPYPDSKTAPLKEIARLLTPPGDPGKKKNHPLSHPQGRLTLRNENAILTTQMMKKRGGPHHPRHSVSLKEKDGDSSLGPPLIISSKTLKDLT